MTKYGKGGRSSVNGLTVTVFGATGFVGRYLLSELGMICFFLMLDEVNIFYQQFLGACGTRVYVPFRGDELEVRHLKPMFDLGQVKIFPYC